jgi:hypothetical protein
MLEDKLSFEGGRVMLQFCASTCSATTDQAKLANLGYLSMR